MSVWDSVKKGVKKGVGAVKDVAEDTVDVAKSGVKAVGKGIEAVTDPLQKMADNKVFRAIDKAYKGAIPEPYGGYMKAMCSSSALVGAALSKAKLLPGKGILLSGGQSLLPGHPTYGEITKKGKAAQLKAMSNLLDAAANSPEARKALAELKKAAPDIYAQLEREAKAAKSAAKDLVTHVGKVASTQTKREIQTALSTGFMPRSVVSAAKQGDARARAVIAVTGALKSAQAGAPAAAKQLVSQARAKDSKAKSSAPVATMYKVQTPSGRTILIPASEVK